ncbi:hypothetical protein ZOSMA_223G00070 [Zostera marina]|uniref:Rad21/Rec8-like protein C-terminal eukaryotic domain-containing protein n=1 Tax=Zostera marina TaxID=29655 RepID=A0A0K9PL92_ZOSMR|nr:hypothetical protein ZOSMA_223G00070 [Zostera marina]
MHFIFIYCCQTTFITGMCENLKVACNIKFPITRIDLGQPDHPEVDNNEQVDGGNNECMHGAIEDQSQIYYHTNLPEDDNNEQVDLGIDECVHDAIEDQPQIHCDTNLPVVDNTEEFDGVTGSIQVSTQIGSLGDLPQFHGLNNNDLRNDNNGEQSPERIRANSGFDENLIQESPSGRNKDSSTIHSNSENFNTEFPNLTPETENNDLVEPQSRSGIPLDFCNDDDLNFLSEDSTAILQCTPTRIGKNEVCTMSARARSVLKYLKKQQQANQSDYLCLNSILENQGRKQSARMFSVTLSLKTLGIIDVQQSEDYGPIMILLDGTCSSEMKV